MTARTDSCDVRWCDERPGHDGNHRGYVWETYGDPANLNRTLSLTLECGPVERTPLPVVTVGTNGGVAVIRLNWDQAGRLAHWLADSADRWAP